MESDDFANRLRRERSRLCEQYASLFDEIAVILFEYDPMGLNFDTHTDEYEPEAQTILPRLDGASSVEDVEKIVLEEFDRFFGDTHSERRVGPCASAAADIWQTWSRWHQNDGHPGQRAHSGE